MKKKKKKKMMMMKGARQKHKTLNIFLGHRTANLHMPSFSQHSTHFLDTQNCTQNCTFTHVQLLSTLNPARYIIQGALYKYSLPIDEEGTALRPLHTVAQWTWKETMFRTLCPLP